MDRSIPTKGMTPQTGRVAPTISWAASLAKAGIAARRNSAVQLNNFASRFIEITNPSYTENK